MAKILSLQVVNATFAQPRSYFVTAELLKNNASVQDSTAKFKTPISEGTKKPQFDCEPFLMAFPDDQKADSDIGEC